MAMSVQAIGGVWDNCFWMLVIFPGSLSLVVDLCWFWYWHGVEMVTIHHLIQWSTVSRNQCIFDDIQEMGTWFEISLVRSFEMSKNDSRTSGIRAVLVRRTTVYFWFSQKLHWLDFRQVNGTFRQMIFSCDQAALWMVFSVRLSVCPSVRLSVRLSVCLSVRLSVCPSVTPFWLCSHHRIIMKFSGVITLDQGKVHAKGQGQRSKVKVTEVTTQIFVSGL